MDFLNRSIAQLQDLFQSMTVGARITSALLLATVVISLGFLFQGKYVGGEEELLGGQSFTPNEYYRMLAAFSANNLPEPTTVGYSIRVPRGQKSAYMAALVQADALPKRFGDHISKSLSSSGAFTTNWHQKEMKEAAILQELSSWFGMLPGVEQALVLFDEADRPGFGREKQRTATVSLKTLGGQRLPENLVQSIRSVMQGAFAGLKLENIQISDEQGTYPTPGNEFGFPGNGSYLYLTRNWQNSFERDIREALNYIPGVIVKAAVTLDTQQRRQELKTNYDPDNTVAVQVKEESSSTNSQEPAPAGRPGVVAQQPNAPAALNNVQGPSNNAEESSSERNSVVASGTVETEYTGHTPQEVSVSVSVPRNYFVELWRTQTQAAADAEPTPGDLATIENFETTKIKAAVNNLLPKVVGGADPLSRISVTQFAKVVQNPITGPTSFDKILSWLDVNWGTLAMLGLVLISILMMRSLLRASPAATSQEGLFPDSLFATVGPDEDVEEEDAAPLRRTHTKSDLRTELSELVQEDPDAAAAVLRSWIGDVR